MPPDVTGSRPQTSTRGWFYSRDGRRGRWSRCRTGGASDGANCTTWPCGARVERCGRSWVGEPGQCDVQSQACRSVGAWWWCCRGHPDRHQRHVRLGHALSRSHQRCCHRRMVRRDYLHGRGIRRRARDGLHDERVVIQLQLHGPGWRPVLRRRVHLVRLGLLPTDADCGVLMMPNAHVINRSLITLRTAASVLVAGLTLALVVLLRMGAASSSVGAPTAGADPGPSPTEHPYLGADQEQQIVLADRIDAMIRDCMSESGLTWHTGYLAAVLRNVAGHGQIRAAAGEETGERVANHLSEVDVPDAPAPFDPNEAERSSLSEGARRVWLETALTCQDRAHASVGLSVADER
jgi:hypothetical protein